MTQCASSGRDLQDPEPRSDRASSSPAQASPASAAHQPGEAPKISTQWRKASGSPKARVIRASRPFGVALFHSLFRMTVLGVENIPREGPVLLAGNHTGFLDGPLVYAFSPRQTIFLTKAELFVGPLGRALGWLGQVPIHRGKPDRTALRTGRAVLAAGGAMGVFPEGTRGAGLLDNVSDGFAYLALKSGAPVVPIAVLGTAEALPKGAKLPRWRAPVTVSFGAPVQLTTKGDSRVRRTVREAAEELRLVLLAHLEQSHLEAQRLALADAPRVDAPEEHGA